MSQPSFIVLENSVLIIIDVQEKLLRVIHEKDKLLDNLLKLIRGVQVLGMPVILVEQYPQGLGPTIPEIISLLPDIQSIPRLSFSCCGEKRFLKELEALNRKQVLITGIESHVCVYQSTIDLLNAGYELHVVTDCVSSRTPENKKIALHRMNSAGAKLTSTEMALFELLRVAGGEKFKAISRIIK